MYVRINIIFLYRFYLDIAFEVIMDHWYHLNVYLTKFNDISKTPMSTRRGVLGRLHTNEPFFVNVLGPCDLRAIDIFLPLHKFLRLQYI